MKKDARLFSILILIMFIVTGCNKKPVNEPVKPEEPKEVVMSVSNDTKEVDCFNDFVAALTYTYDLELNVYNSLTAQIKDDGVIVAKFSAENEGDKEVTRQITLKEKPNGIAITYDYKTGIGYIYVLTKSYKVYLVELTRTSDIKIVRYDVNNVEGIISMNLDLEEKKNFQPFVLIKTKDNKYYTDYKFLTDTEKVLREVIAPSKNQE